MTCFCHWGGSGPCPCNRQYPYNYPYPWYPSTYLCWCGQYHTYGYTHYKPYFPPIQIQTYTVPTPQRRPGELKKEDIDKAKDILKGK